MLIENIFEILFEFDYSFLNIIDAKKSTTKCIYPKQTMFILKILDFIKLHV
jgi:hypothetical protein